MGLNLHCTLVNLRAWDIQLFRNASCVFVHKPLNRFWNSHLRMIWLLVKIWQQRRYFCFKGGIHNVTQREIMRDTGTSWKKLRKTHRCLENLDICVQILQNLQYLRHISFLLPADHGSSDVFLKISSSTQGKGKAMPKLPSASEGLSFRFWFLHLGVNLALGYDAHFCQMWLVLITCYLDQYGSLFDACSNCSLLCIL